MSSAYLHDLAVDLLVAAEAAVDPICTGNELPPRRYVSYGEPAWDICQGDERVAASGQLVTWWADVQPVVSAQGRSCAIQYRGRLCVELARCFPSLSADSQPLPAEVYEAAAAVVSTDAWALVRGVGAWVASLGCSWAQIEDVFPSGPEGGMAAVRICIRLELDDPDPACTPPAP